MMIFKIKAALLKASINSNSKIAVAYSGGCDSTALLHNLNRLKKEFGYSLIAIHVNHGIRDSEAERDAEHAVAFCKALDIDCVVYNCDVPKVSRETGESTELCARKLRYGVFEKYIKQGYIIATAHTSSDNTETVLFNLARGTGIKGLCGIPFMRDGLVRPMLSCSREETEEYCIGNNIDFVTDSTNLSDDYTRNFIRHNVVTALKSVNSDLDSSIESMTYQMSDIDQLLKKLTDNAYAEARISDNEFYRNKLLNLDKAVLTRLIRHIIFDLFDINADYCITGRVYDTLYNGGKTQIKDKFFVSATKNTVRFYKESAISEFSAKLVIGEFSNEFFKLNITSAQVVNKLLMQSTIDYDKIYGKALIRSRQPGDCIKLKNRPNKQVRRLMNESEIASYLRDALPIIADELGVIYVPYIGVAERVCADENSKNLIIVTLEGKDND